MSITLPSLSTYMQQVKPNPDALSEVHPWIVWRNLEGEIRTNVAQPQDIEQEKGKVLKKYTLPQLVKHTNRIFDKHVKDFEKNVKAFEKSLERIDDNDIDLKIFGKDLLTKIGIFYGKDLPEFQKTYDVLSDMALRANNKRRAEKTEGIWKKFLYFIWSFFCDQTKSIDQYKTRITTINNKKEAHYDELLKKTYQLISRFAENSKKEITDSEKKVCQEKNQALSNLLSVFMTYAPTNIVQKYHNQYAASSLVSNNKTTKLQNP